MQENNEFFIPEETNTGKEATYLKLKEEIEKRCLNSKITFEVAKTPSGNDYLFKVYFPAGREKRENRYSLENLQMLLKTPFETYVFIPGYQAICSYQDGWIEAHISIQNASMVPGPSYILRQLFYLMATGRPLTAAATSQFLQGDEEKDFEISLFDTVRNVFIKFGPPSDTFRAILPRRFPFTLKITGLKISTSEQATDYLIKISNAVFFEIDLIYNHALKLNRFRPYKPIGKRKASFPDPNCFQFPRGEYDEAPMSLYWYAVSANGMPLLQFLAYYQVLEFYFPRYSKIEVQKRIQNILKHPNFNPYRDSDIDKILAVIKPGTFRGYGDERSQLLATVQGCCLDYQILWEFLTEDDDRREALSKSKFLPKQNLPLTDNKQKHGPIDVREQVAGRIYEIRCRIVHTKNDASDDVEQELLLPFSKEAESLDYDIELVRYIAQQVLVANSRSLQI